MLYMKIDQIEGPVTKAGRGGWLKIESMQWGVGRGIASPSRNLEERVMYLPSISEVTINRISDMCMTSTIACAMSKEARIVEIAFFTNDGESPASSFTLFETLISGYSVSTREMKLSESISFNFSKITVQNFEQGAPKTTFSYDIVEELEADKKLRPEHYAEREGRGY